MTFVEKLDNNFISETLLMSLVDLLIIVNKDGNVVYNKLNSKSGVFEENNIRNKVPISDLFSDNIPSLIKEAILQCEINEDIVRFNFHIENSEKLFFVKCSVQSFKDNSEDYFLLLFNDETEHYLVKENLNNNNIILDKIQSSIRIAYFIFNLNTNEVLFSTFSNTLLKIDQNIRLTFEKYLNLIHYTDRKIIENAIENIKVDKIPSVLEYQLLYNGKKHCRHLLHLEPVFDGTSSNINIIGIIQDVSELRVLEDQFYKNFKTKELIVNAIPDIMFTQKHDGTFIDYLVPKSQRELLLTAPDKFIGKKSVEVLPPDVAVSNLEKIKQVLLTKEIIQFEYQLNIKNRLHYFEARMMPAGEDEVFSIVRDVTSRKHAQQELIKAKMKAEESDRLKSAFLANMSHEIRTPMNGILGFAELLISDDISKNERIEYYEIIQNNSNQLLALIDDIIDLAKLEAEQMELHMVDFNLNKTINDLLNLYKKEIQLTGKDIKISGECFFENQHAYICSDKARLVQILQNLLTNAIKFTEKGEIKVKYELQNSHLVFQVSDTGIGISKLAQKQVFDRFKRIDNPADKIYRGTGLGLAVTKGLVEILGGEISLTSQENYGSTFKFTIPYYKVSNQKSKINMQTNTDVFEGKTVLIVEDEDTSYQFLNSLFKRQGMKVYRADNGYNAIEMVQSVNFDLVLMDIQLPDLNGYEATRKIKQIAPNLPIIAQTAFAMKGDSEKSFNAGCDDYITKPISRKLLFEKMAMQLQKHSKK